MAKFILIYKGKATDPADMSEEDAKAVMDKWAEWMKKIGSALVDVGQPMANGESVVDDGSDGSAVELSGYSIVEADDKAGAKALAADHPFLSEGEGNYAVDVYEMMRMHPSRSNYKELLFFKY